MAETIFERIVAREIPARIVHETDTTLAFLDANPLAPGHTLVIPKTPHERLADLPAAEAADLFAVVHTLAPAIERAVEADATTVGINDGEAAGQEVPHVHVHVIPRFDGDGGGPIHAVAPDSPALSEDDLDSIADSITDAVDA
jgi:histidine triad (HIT) family protein